MKVIRNLVLLGIAAGFAAKAEVPAGWSTNLSFPLNGTNRPTVLFFTASWCGPCRLMARTTLTNTAVQLALDSFERVAVDIDAHPDLAEQHEIRAVPTFLILSVSGDEVERTTGYAPPEEFLPWLTNGLVQAQTAFARHTRSLEQLKEIDQFLAATNVDSSKMTAALFALCADRDAALSGAAGARLKQLAARSPATVLDGLNDPRLATRICIANILRNQLGESFDVDPWDESASRAAAVEEWRKKLAK